jgi:indolepyruvate ferredoxin oxidoreductase alpha subunit
MDSVQETKDKAAASLGALPVRPPTFCVGCPERPVFSAMKLVAQDIGRPHVSMDVGCHAFASFEPFSQGNTLLGYGMSLASAAGVGPMSSRRTVSVMGDGGFWHNGLLSGVASNLLNKGDGVLVIMKNGYASATGTQELLSSPDEEARTVSEGGSAVHADRTIEDTLTGLGVKWLRTVNNYRVGDMAKTYKEAMTTKEKGLKVIVAEGECQLERQRRVRPQVSEKLKNGERHVRVKYGVDEDTCTGDHSCIRLSGCPTLTIKDNPDPLRTDPVATVIDGCVGCGLCGENAHAAVLCPSFYRAEVIQNPGFFDRFIFGMRSLFV